MRFLSVVLLAGAAGALAQEPSPPHAAAPPADILSRRIVLAVDGVDRVVRRNLRYRVADDLQLPMDVYIPPGLQAGARRPAVIFIHGGPMAPDMSPTEWGCIARTESWRPHPASSESPSNIV